MPSARAAARRPISITPRDYPDHAGRHIASRVREKLAYDFREGKFTNSEKANALLKRKPRKGWEFGYS